MNFIQAAVILVWFFCCHCPVFTEHLLCILCMKWMHSANFMYVWSIHICVSHQIISVKPGTLNIVRFHSGLYFSYILYFMWSSNCYSPNVSNIWMYKKNCTWLQYKKTDTYNFCFEQFSEWCILNKVQVKIAYSITHCKIRMRLILWATRLISMVNEYDEWDWMFWLSGQHSCFIFKMSWFQLLWLRLCGFPQSVKADARIVPWIWLWLPGSTLLAGDYFIPLHFWLNNDLWE
jgi:hypothetical protein